MKKSDWTVTADDEGIRPAGPKDECFYCQVKIGGQHGAECVIRKRTVIVELTIQVAVAVPEYWDDDAIEFRYNESSACKNGLIEDIVRMQERMRTAGNCLCSAGEVTFVREADAEDEECYQTFVGRKTENPQT